MKRTKYTVRRITWVVIGLAIVAAIGIGIVTSHGGSPAQASAKLQVVAGENFWGSLVSQLGGDKVSVQSVVSDPNADPHEYETNTATARAFATANYVILNGAGYDSWGQKLLGASTNAQRRELTVAALLGKSDGDNPHFWYNPAYVNKVIVQMDNDLIALEPSQKAYFQRQLTAVRAALAPYQRHIAAIKQQFGATPVAATEDIFVYLASAAGLNLISPPAFIQAVAEGNDPPAPSVAAFQQQLQSADPRVLVYNRQTVTPLTESIKRLASQQHIPIVGITETIQPPHATFEAWMDGQLTQLQTALKGE